MSATSSASVPKPPFGPAALAHGRQGGRPKGLSKEAFSKAQAAKTLYLQQDKTVAEIGQLLGVGRVISHHLPLPRASGRLDGWQSDQSVSAAYARRISH